MGIPGFDLWEFYEGIKDLFQGINPLKKIFGNRKNYLKYSILKEKNDFELYLQYAFNPYCLL